MKKYLEYFFVAFICALALILACSYAHASQGYADLPTTTPPGLSGTALVTGTNANTDALLTNNIGTSAPAYISTGSIWINSTTTTNNVVDIYDGTNSVSIGGLNRTAHAWNPTGAAAVFTTLGLGTSSPANTLDVFSGGIHIGSSIPASPTFALYNNAGTLMWNGSSVGGGGSGTVTSVATTSPITGGTFTTSGTIACATCVTSAAALTSGAIVTGGGLQASATDASASLSVGALSLGASGTAGSVKLGNATSGTVTIQPVTGALGTVTVSLPAITDTLVALTATQTLTNKTLAAGSNTLTGIGTSNLGGITGSPSSSNFLRGDGTWNTPSGAGTVTTSGSPTSGNMAKFTGATAISNGDLSGDCTTTGSLAINCTKTAGTAFSALATTTPGSGIATFLATPTSANLASAITDETGTGAAVFAGSPTLTGTIGAAAITATGLVTGAAFVAPPSTLTISTATFTPVAVASNTYRVVLVHASCPCTIANPSGTASDGQKFILEVWQSATGSDTVGTWGTNYDFGTAGSPTLSTGASKGDLLGFTYSAQNSKYLYLGVQQGM